MTVKILRSGVLKIKETRTMLRGIEEMLAVFHAAKDELESGDESKMEVIREYLIDRIRVADRIAMIGELTMRLSFLMDGYEHFTKLIAEADKAGEN